MDKHESAMTYFGERGLEYWHTGGGCAAFGRNLDDGKSFVLVTHIDGHMPPIEGQEITVALYSDGELFDGFYDTADTFDTAMEKLNDLIAKHIKD
jgi:hypothetical protein